MTYDEPKRPQEEMRRVSSREGDNGISPSLLGWTPHEVRRTMGTAHLQAECQIQVPTMSRMSKAERDLWVAIDKILVKLQRVEDKLNSHLKEGKI